MRVGGPEAKPADSEQTDPARDREGRVATVAHQCAVCGERFPASYRLCPKDGATLDRVLQRRQAADPLIGAVLGGSYRVIRPLAVGGMGRLYRAEHTRLNTQVVAKVIHPELADRDAAQQRLEREAEALLQVHSPHVLRLLDRCGTHDGRLALVFEWLEGADVAATLRRETALPVLRALTIGHQLSLALAAAHRAGILHRDIKPSNVFIQRNDEGGDWVKLLDFGVAKLASEDDITRDGALLGTPAYMAPEQARGAGHVDERSDVYGVCAVLYHMLTGTSPAPETDPEAQLAWLQRSFAPPSLRKEAKVKKGTLPDGIAAVIDQGLSREPAERPQSARALAEALDEAIRTLQANRSAPPSVPQGGRTTRKTKAPQDRRAGSTKGRFYAVAIPIFAALWTALLTDALDWSVTAVRLAAAAAGASAVMGLWKLARRNATQPRVKAQVEWIVRLGNGVRHGFWLLAIGVVAVLSVASLSGRTPLQADERLWLTLAVAIAFGFGAVAARKPTSAG